MEQTLKLNKETNLYEASILIQVEPEIFKRMLYRYLEEQNIDPGNIEAYTEALYHVSKVSKWLEHKRVTIVIPEATKEIVKQQEKVKEQTEKPIMLQEPKVLSVYRSAIKLTHMTEERADEFRVKLLAVPVDQWESMLTPLLPNTASGIDRRRAYYIRYDERRIIEQLKKELEPANMERLQVVAQATNSARMK